MDVGVRVYKATGGKTTPATIVAKLWDMITAEAVLAQCVSAEVARRKSEFQAAEKREFGAEGKLRDATDQDIADGRRPDLKLTFGG